MQKTKSLCALSFLFLFACCSSTSTLTQKELHDKFGTGHRYIFNSDSSYVLSLKKTSQDINHLVPLSFFIYDVQLDSVVYRESLPGGNVMWKNESMIEVTIIPGNISGDEEESDMHFIYDVKERRKIYNNN